MLRFYKQQNRIIYGHLKSSLKFWGWSHTYIYVVFAVQMMSEAIILNVPLPSIFEYLRSLYCLRSTLFPYLIYCTVTIHTHTKNTFFLIRQNHQILNLMCLSTINTKMLTFVLMQIMLKSSFSWISVLHLH